MQETQWDANIPETAFFVVKNAPRYLADPALPNEGKPQALRLMAGHNWSREAVELVSANKLPGLAQLDLRNPAT